MNKALVILALCASVVMPVVASAQTAPPTPSPELRSMMEKLHAQAKMAAYAGLTPAHAAAVNALVAKIAAGTLNPRAGTQQIDDLLTADEDKTVLVAARKQREAMHSAMVAAGVPPMGPMGMEHGGPPGGPGGPGGFGGPPRMGGPDGHGGPPGGFGHGQRGRHGFGHMSPGRYLVMVSLTPEQMHGLRRSPRARSSAAP